MSALFLTVEGVVGTEPRRAVINGSPVLSFRMVANERRWDGSTQTWLDLHASWLTVSCYRNVARNVDASIKKGDRLVVHGKMRIRDYVTSDGERRTSVDVDANSIGHDLRFGSTRFRPMRTADNADDPLREGADELGRQLAELPQPSVAELLAHRASLPDDPDDLDDEEGLDEDGADGADGLDELDGADGAVDLAVVR